VGANVIEAGPEEDGTDLDGDDANVGRRSVTVELEPGPEVALAEVMNEIEARSHRLTEDEVDAGGE